MMVRVIFFFCLSVLCDVVWSSDRAVWGMHLGRVSELCELEKVRG
jgi:hypothetical protein